MGTEAGKIIYMKKNEFEENDDKLSLQEMRNVLGGLDIENILSQTEDGGSDAGPNCAGPTCVSACTLGCAQRCFLGCYMGGGISPK